MLLALITIVTGTQFLTKSPKNGENVPNCDIAALCVPDFCRYGKLIYNADLFKNTYITYCL